MGLWSTYRRCRFWQKKTIFSDEAHFDVGIENPHAYIEKPTHLKRVTVWCGFWSIGRIGQFFFENEQEEAVRVNGDLYRAILKEFLFTKIEEADIGNIWFQQDGTRCHSAEATLDILRPVFEDRIISCRVESFGHLGAAIWHRWTIICGVPSKIRVTATSRRQLML